MNEPHTVSVITLGCKVNQYDTDAMLAVFDGAGIPVREGLTQADAYIVNTCAVTAEAERKSRQTIGKILKINPSAKIFVCGCASQNNFSQFAKDNVVFISGTEGKTELAKRIASRLIDDDTENDFSPIEGKIVTSDFSIAHEFEDNDGVMTFKTRHFVKVQDGCDNFCSYCIVPYLRGRSRSRSLTGIMRELDEAARQGAKEAVITGINLSAYGRDMNISLTSLLIALQKYDMRFRLGSLEAGVITEEFLDAAGGLKSFCPHFHLSLQSGDDGVLKAMNRRYTCENFAEAVKLIRSRFPNAGITTDIIVGFPTETEEAFENSMAFAEKIGFSDIHVFPYSSRKGTAAGKLKTLPPEITEERAKRMTEVKKRLNSAFLGSALGKEQNVLFETKEDGMWCGRSENYVKVYSTYGKRNSIEKVIPTALYNDGVRV